MAIDTVDRPWPDDMGDPKENAEVFAAWSMGHFGPYTYPGGLQRLMGQGYSQDDALVMPPRPALRWLPVDGTTRPAGLMQPS
jgi:hypothetical protein